MTDTDTTATKVANTANSIIQAYKDVDLKLFLLGRRIKPLHYVWPLNHDEEKEKFLAEQTTDPKFEYKKPHYNTAKIRQLLLSINIPEGPLKEIYESARQELLDKNEIIDHIGTDAVKVITQKLYGKPSEQLLTLAKEILQKPHPGRKTYDIPAKEVKNYLAERLVEYGLHDWRVFYSKKELTTVFSHTKKISVCKRRSFAKGDAQRLAVHEVGVHALRAANGFMQQLQILAVGLPNYLATEEGLASFCEEYTGNSDENMMRQYAARVIAIDSAVAGQSFTETFLLLKEYQFSEEQAWGIAVRAHRAGGFIKDHIYLDGYMKVKEYASNGGDLSLLYVGKISLEHIPLITSLLEQGIVQKPRLLPFFLRDEKHENENKNNLEN